MTSPTEAARILYVEALESGDYLQCKHQWSTTIDGIEYNCAFGVAIVLFGLDPMLYSDARKTHQILGLESNRDFNVLTGITSMNDRGESLCEIATYLRQVWSLPLPESPSKMACSTSR